MHTNEERDLIVKQAPAVSSCYHFRTDLLILLLPVSDHNQQPTPTPDPLSLLLPISDNQQPDI